MTSRSSKQELRSILQANTPGPLQLAALLEPFAYLLDIDPVEHAEAFAATAMTTGAGSRRVPDLALYAAEVDRLQGAIAEVTAICTDDVHTGEAGTRTSFVMQTMPRLYTVPFNAF